MSFSSDNIRELNPWADPWWAHIARAAADEIERLRAENARLREALECLIDEQNGPPLEVHAKSWCAAMDRARAALAEQEKTDD